MTPDAFSVPPWVLGLGVLLSTFGPGVAAFFFSRWLKRQDEATAQAKKAEAEKLDQVLSGVKRLETEVGGLSQRLALSDALQNQLKGSLEKVEERINGIGATYGKRLGELEALIQRLDERTRNDAPRRRK